MSTMAARRADEDRNGRATARTFGVVLAWLYVFLRKRGKVRVEGYERAVRALAEGGVILAANHPDGATPFLIPAVFHEHYFNDPRFFLWNMPRERLVPTEFLRDRLRCILIERDNPTQKAGAARKAARELKARNNILVFGEGTRTFNKREPNAVIIESNGRFMRPVDETAVPYLAKLGNALIMPVWIRMPGVRGKLGFCRSIFHLFKRRGRRMTISFGEPYRVGEPFDLERENARLQQAIFNA
jgi:1-acyl-sn-glycerol-3-phosphate acyltransferase